MARYFGGFRDRLKKRSKHLPITIKDVEWVKVAATFSWSPARRDYQWLEPEDYLSSFLSNSQNLLDEQNEIRGDGSVNPAMELPFSGNEYDGSQTLIGTPAHEDKIEEEVNNFGYIPPYDFVTETGASFGDDQTLRPNIDVPAELPLLDEYRLEIVSALQRRGIKIRPDKINLPEDLAAQLTGYHQGRVSIDSYELRARLQKYKRQVIESYEHFDKVLEPVQAKNDKKVLTVEDVTEPDEVVADEEDYETFILSSLNRLEASMNEDELAFNALQNLSAQESGEDAPDKDVVEDTPQSLDVRSTIRNNRYLETPPTTSDILAEGLMGLDQKNYDADDELPSSYADDSWLVLPVDSRKAGLDLENPDDLDHFVDIDNFEDLDDIEDISETTIPRDVNDLPATLADEHFSLESNRADSTELLKALNTINSRFPEASNDEDDLDLISDFLEDEIEPIKTLEIPLDLKFTDHAESDPLLEDLEPISAADAALDSTSQDTLQEEPVDDTSLSELLLQLRHDGDKAILNDRSITGREHSSGAKRGVPDEQKPPVIEFKTAYPEPEVAPEIDNAESESPEIDDYDVATAYKPASFAGEIGSDSEELFIETSGMLEPPDMLQTTDIPEETVYPEAPELTEEITFIEDKNSILTLDAALDGIPARASESIETKTPIEENALPEKALETEILKETVLTETVEQKRARFIEEERKKLYLLVDDLEENASVTSTKKTEKESFALYGQERSLAKDGLPGEKPAAHVKKIVSPQPGLASPESKKEESEPVQKPAIQTDRSHLQDLVSPEPGRRSFGSIHALVPEFIQDEVNKPVGKDKRTPEDENPPAMPANLDHEESLHIEPLVSLGVLEPVFLSEESNPQRVDNKDEMPDHKETIIKSSLAPEIVTIGPEAIESEQLRPVSKDKILMAELQTSEFKTPLNADVVTVDVKAFQADGFEEKVEDKAEEGLIEADEALSNEVSLESVIESLAFATEDPIPLKKIASIYAEILGVRMPPEKAVREAVASLNDQYSQNGRSFRIKEWAGGVRMASHPQYARFIRALYEDHRPKKLSRTLMETLAIIAYSQPSTKPEIDFVRGVDSDYAVRKLLELGLIDIVGRSESLGRPLLYGTSERFLEQFGLSEIEALPKLREVEDLLGDPSFKKERLQLLALEEMESFNGSSEDDADPTSMADEEETFDEVMPDTLPDATSPGE